MRIGVVHTAAQRVAHTCTWKRTCPHPCRPSWSSHMRVHMRVHPPWSSGWSSNSLSELLHLGWRSSALGLMTMSGLRNWRCTCEGGRGGRVCVCRRVRTLHAARLLATRTTTPAPAPSCAITPLRPPASPPPHLLTPPSPLPPPRPPHLAPEHVEEVGGRRHVHHLPVGLLHLRAQVPAAQPVRLVDLGHLVRVLVAHLRRVGVCCVSVCLCVYVCVCVCVLRACVCSGAKGTGSSGAGGAARGAAWLYPWARMHTTAPARRTHTQHAPAGSAPGARTSAPGPGRRSRAAAGTPCPPAAATWPRRSSGTGRT